MLSSALIAFGHFMAFFSLTAAVVTKLVLISDSMSVETAQRVRRADRVAGMAAVLALVFGFLRVLYFDKGADYYFANTFFQIKLGLFFAAASLSIYATVQFARWGTALRENTVPEVSIALVKRIKRILHWELIALAGVLLCASLMARGFGIQE